MSTLTTVSTTNQLLDEMVESSEYLVAFMRLMVHGHFSHLNAVVPLGLLRLCGSQDWPLPTVFQDALMETLRESKPRKLCAVYAAALDVVGNNYVRPILTSPDNAGASEEVRQEALSNLDVEKAKVIFQSIGAKLANVENYFFMAAIFRNLRYITDVPASDFPSAVYNATRNEPAGSHIAWSKEAKKLCYNAYSNAMIQDFTVKEEKFSGLDAFDLDAYDPPLWGNMVLTREALAVISHFQQSMVATHSTRHYFRRHASNPLVGFSPSFMVQGRMRVEVSNISAITAVSSGLAQAGKFPDAQFTVRPEKTT